MYFWACWWATLDTSEMKPKQNSGNAMLRDARPAAWETHTYTKNSLKFSCSGFPRWTIAAGLEKEPKRVLPLNGRCVVRKLHFNTYVHVTAGKKVRKKSTGCGLQVRCQQYYQTFHEQLTKDLQWRGLIGTLDIVFFTTDTQTKGNRCKF